MPNTDEDAARELTELRKSLGVTARAIATSLGVTESWLSRRLGGLIDMKVGEYNAIKNAIDMIADSQNNRTPGAPTPGVR